MNNESVPLSLEEANEAFQLASSPKALAAQFVGTVCSLLVVYVFAVAGVSVLDTYSLPGLSLFALGGLLGYPVLAASLLASTAMGGGREPLGIRDLFGSLRPRMLRVLICSFGCALASVALCIPHLVLIWLGTVGDAGEVLYAVFFVPLLVLTAVQLLLLFVGLFIVPQFLAVEEGRVTAMFETFRGMLLVGWRRLVCRHLVAIALSCLLALPFLLAVNASVGLLSFLTVVVKGAPGAAGPAAACGPASPELLAAALSTCPVSLQANEFARFLTGVALVFAYSIPLTIGVLFQSASGVLALRAISEGSTFEDYAPPSTE